MHIFRLDRKADREGAARTAIDRGVVVRTLIAHTARGGEKALRKLEQRLLEIGATVSRSADDLVRYHGKIMIVDRETLFVLGYNLTRARHRPAAAASASPPRKPRPGARRRSSCSRRTSTASPTTGNARDFLVSPRQRARAAGRASSRSAQTQLLIYAAGDATTP